MSRALPPGSVIGILGTGQLGRMLAMAAARLGFRVITYGPEDHPPAAEVASGHMACAYDDVAALSEFASRIAVATYEFENIPPNAVKTIAGTGVPVRPNEKVLAVSQDRLVEKSFLIDRGVRTAPFYPVGRLSELNAALKALSGEGILKTRCFGYDGKGQVRIAAGDDPALAWEESGQLPAILEGLVLFDMEVSMLAARDVDGTVVSYDIPRNVHRDGILRESHVPAGLPHSVCVQAERITADIMEAVDYVGVMAVEFFWSDTDGLIANEIAPRVHNSGHWTQEACQVSQFEQHIRAVAGWPLGSASRHSNAVMTNLIGHDADGWEKLSRSPDLSVTFYGKSTVRSGRKMGHTVSLSPAGSEAG